MPEPTSAPATSSVSLTEPRRWWGLAVLFPVLFGGGHAAPLLAGELSAPTVGAGHPAIAMIWVAKWLTVPSIPILLVLLAEKVAERPSRWRAATLLWLVVGVALVLAVSTRIDVISREISNAASWRLWPGELTEAGQRSLDEAGGFGPRWTPGQILTLELIAVGALAIAAGLALRRCARVGMAALASGAVPLAVMAVLLVYRLVAPWSFHSDFDFFVGEVVLGATLGELLFLPAPFDPIGSAAIGLAALSMGGLIVAWGGVTLPEHEGPVRATGSHPAGEATDRGSLPGARSGS